MTNKNIELLNEANKLFLKKLFRDSLPIYDEILKSEPENIDVINNLLEFSEAIKVAQKSLGIKFIYVKCAYDEETPRPPVNIVTNHTF